MINPYQQVRWETVGRIVSTSHMHLTTTEALDNAWQNGGMRHLAISNYYPSAPVYPLETPVYPVKFEHIPEGAIGMPNAEHHSFTDNPGLHLLALGSTFVSGQPQGCQPVGYQGTVASFCNKVKKSMLYPGGGGVIIAHPKWSGLTTADLIGLLDANDAIIGIEIFNEGASNRERYAYPRTLPSYDQWDEILATGRHTYGFWVPDHSLGRHGDCAGKNILLVDRPTEKDCAMAYGNGVFYGMMMLTTLAFTRIEATLKGLYVSVNEPCDITFISEKGKAAFASSAMSLALHWGETESPVFLRVEASHSSGSIFSQAIQFKCK